jgi:uncharacterized Tic20 family protein
MSDAPNQQPPTSDYGSTPLGSKDERMWATFCHVAALAFFIPLGNIIGPLVIWLIKKDEYPLVHDQGKASLNFQITVTIGFVISIILVPVVGIGILTGLVLLVCDLVFVISAALKANAGEAYRYPFAIQFVK